MHAKKWIINTLIAVLMIAVFATVAMYDRSLKAKPRLVEFEPVTTPR